MMRPRRAVLARDDGISMASALMVTIVGLAITGLITGMILFTLRQAQRSAETIKDRAVAEAGIDSAIAAIEQSTSPGQLPCRIPEDPNDAATQLGFTATITYFETQASFDNGNGLPCFDPGVPNSPQFAKIVSVGSAATAGPAGSTNQRTVEAVVSLERGGGGGGGGGGDVSWLEYSISTGLNLAGNNFTLNGAGADVALNGDFECSNSSYSGSVYVQGSATLGADCVIQGSLWSVGDINVTRSTATVGLDVKTQGTLNITQGPFVVGRDIVAATILGSYTAGGTVQTNSDPGSPPRPSYTKIDYDATAWSNAGYTEVIPNNSRTFPCDGNPKTFQSPNTPTVYVANTGSGAACTSISWAGNPEIVLNSDLAIISDSFNFGSNLVFRSSPAGTPRTVHLITPWTSSTDTCPVPGAENIETRGSFTAEPGVEVFIYTPGTVTIQSRFQSTGQVFGCNLDARSEVVLNFQLIDVPGVSGPTPSPTGTVSPTPTPTPSPSATGPYVTTLIYQRDI